MREIKFRAWFTRDGKYIKPMSLQNMVHQKVSTFSLSVLYDEVIFEQYTGLHNDDGAELYEGDILLDPDTGYIVGAIEYRVDSFWCGACWLTDCISCQVVGNIHENPELLDVEE